MDKRKLSAVPRKPATEDMLKIAERLGGMSHIVTAEKIFDNKILLLYFYEVEALRKGKTEAAFRTFLSHDDYITQDLKTQRVKWKTASFCMMDNFLLWDSRWNKEKEKYDYRQLVFIHTNEEQKMTADFFSDYAGEKEKLFPWDRVYAFQEAVKERKLAERHKKETDIIDLAMEPIKDAPKEFFDWIWEEGMKFSRYLIYKNSGKNKMECECTYCKKTGTVDRKTVRLRNNEKGVCPFCGSPVTVKAKGRLAYENKDERWFAYIDPTEDGFIFRYFLAQRSLHNDKYISNSVNKSIVEENISELCRVIYTFPQGKPAYTGYEWNVYKQRGGYRWCPDNGKWNCGECILYPDNLPRAWEHTPMKYSGLEYLSRNAPDSLCEYENAIKVYIKYPKLEWIIKMGLNNLAVYLIYHKCRGYIRGYFSKAERLNLEEDTIYKILGLNKVNTKILQKIDGGIEHLRLLQAAESIGLQFKPEQLKEYYNTFGCDTDLLKQTGRKKSLYKIVKYIVKESEKYPAEEHGCGMSLYYGSKRKDPKIERLRNMARDWIEYLGWCEELKYDTNNMFIYMPKNFKIVHDRTAEEYQALQDKKAAEYRKVREAAAKKAMEEMKKALAEILKENDGTDAFSIKGKGLVLVVPKTGDEIRAEGAALHHCVGGYVESVAKGETNIFFIRQADNPDKPYFTLEWKNNDIAQCRGLNNCSMPAEVKVFTQAFKKKMLDSIEKEKYGGAVNGR